MALTQSNYFIGDQITQVELSISFYYTPQIKEAAARLLDTDMTEVVSTLLELSNIILRNNGIPIKLVAHCILPSNIEEPRNEPLNTEVAFNALKNLRGDVATLLNSADVAALLTAGRTEVQGHQM